MRSCTKYPSYEFLISRWLIHNQFIGLGNPLEVIVHYLLIGGIVGLGHRDKVSMMSVLIFMVKHWIGPTVNHNIKLSSSHNLTKMLHYVFSQFWENIELMLKLVVLLTYELYSKVIMYSLWIRSLLKEVSSNRYYQ